MYADEITDSMDKAIKETNRRRKIQEKYNLDNNITPQTIKKGIRDIIRVSKTYEEREEYNIETKEDIQKLIDKLTKEMISYAKDLNFEKAAELRDRISELEELKE